MHDFKTTSARLRLAFEALDKVISVDFTNQDLVLASFREISSISLPTFNRYQLQMLEFDVDVSRALVGTVAVRDRVKYLVEGFLSLLKDSNDIQPAMNAIKGNATVLLGQLQEAVDILEPFVEVRGSDEIAERKMRSADTLGVGRK